jgi:hypothetical protein
MNMHWREGGEEVQLNAGPVAYDMLQNMYPTTTQPFHVVCHPAPHTVEILPLTVSHCFVTPLMFFAHCGCLTTILLYLHPRWLRMVRAALPQVKVAATMLLAAAFVVPSGVSHL